LRSRVAGNAAKLSRCFGPIAAVLSSVGGALAVVGAGRSIRALERSR
jgi:hypothetical protein